LWCSLEMSRRGVWGCCVGVGVVLGGGGGGGFTVDYTFWGAHSSENLRGGHAEDLDIWLAQSEAAFRERERGTASRCCVSTCPQQLEAPPAGPRAT
jgi:hypothetical protein